MSTGLVGKVLEDPRPEPGAAKPRTNVHPLDLAVRGLAARDAADEQDPAAACGATVDAEHEEANALRDEAGHAEPPPALDRVQRREVLLELEDETRGIG